MAKVSICIPFHWMKGWHFYLNTCLESIKNQTFTDYEVILMKVGSMPVTSNRTMLAAQGELIKVLYMDDYFAHANALQEIVDAFTPETRWLVTGCLHQRGDEKPHSYHEPRYTGDIHTGNNCIGSPSVLTLRQRDIRLFDENLSWLLDCDLYKRLHDSYGEPTILDTPNVIIGIHAGQTSNTMSDDLKKQEHQYLLDKYKAK